MELMRCQIGSLFLSDRLFFRSYELRNAIWFFGILSGSDEGVGLIGKCNSYRMSSDINRVEYHFISFKHKCCSASTTRAIVEEEENKAGEDAFVDDLRGSEESRKRLTR